MTIVSSPAGLLLFNVIAASMFYAPCAEVVVVTDVLT